MALKLSEPPPGSNDVMIAGMRRAITEHHTFMKAVPVDTPPAATEVEGIGPIPLFEIPIATLGTYAFPSNLHVTGWKYIIMAQGLIAGTATLRQNADSKMVFAKYQADGFASKILDALHAGEHAFAAKGKDFEPRILEARGLCFCSLWLHRADEDWVFLLEYLATGKMKSFTPLPMEDVRRVLMTKVISCSNWPDPPIH